MKENCNCDLRDLISEHLNAEREKCELAQAEVFNALQMDKRYYTALGRMDELCCVQMFILFLSRLESKRRDALIEDLKNALLKSYGDEPSER